MGAGLTLLPGIGVTMEQELTLPLLPGIRMTVGLEPTPSLHPGTRTDPSLHPRTGAVMGQGPIQGQDQPPPHTLTPGWPQGWD